MELPTIGRLLGQSCLVVAAGGGGIPIAYGPDGPRGVEAVVDEDLTAALVATRLQGDALLLLTDVPAVMSGFGTPQARRLALATPTELRDLGLPDGSMGPKAKAACRFAEHRLGVIAAIGALTDAPGLLTGSAGTRIQVPAGPVA